MRSPRTAALLGLAGLVLSGSAIFFHGPESPSPMLAAIQWFFFAGSGVVLLVSLIQMAAGRE